MARPTRLPSKSPAPSKRRVARQPTTCTPIPRGSKRRPQRYSRHGWSHGSEPPAGLAMLHRRRDRPKAARARGSVPKGAEMPFSGTQGLDSANISDHVVDGRRGQTTTPARPSGGSRSWKRENQAKGGGDPDCGGAGWGSISPGRHGFEGAFAAIPLLRRARPGGNRV